MLIDLKESNEKSKLEIDKLKTEVAKLSKENDLLKRFNQNSKSSSSQMM